MSNKEYTEEVLPFIVENYDLNKPNATFDNIFDFIGLVEQSATQDDVVASHILYSYYVVHLN